MHLLERDPILAELDELLASAASGTGRLAAVSGEAGIGKTSLVECFAARHRDRARVLHGLCDPLATPRLLGPIVDMAPQSRGPLAAALRDGAGRDTLLSAFVAELQREPTPCIVLVEDLHWADDATLDLLRFAGRRLRALPALLLVTFRDDEIGAEHQLRHLLGELPQDVVRRLPLPLLSEGAVEEIARRQGRSADGVWALTGGNSFFVTEVLAARGTAVPASIREAMLARGARLSSAARALLDLVAVMPGRAERRLLEALLPDAAALARECVDAGVLVAGAESVGFRHELARLAWQEHFEPGASARLHGRILAGLLDAPERDGARIVHHADGAGDAARVLHFAPESARAAAAAGAHRQAAAHYATALRHAGALRAASRVVLLEAYAYERYLAGAMADAARAYGEALAIRRQLDDRRGEGTDLRWLSRLTWFDGRRADAVALGDHAIAVLEPLGPTPELAMAYSNRAQLCMLAEDATGATAWGERAIAMAEALGDVETLVHALTNVGSAEMYTAGERGVARLQQAIVLAERHQFYEHAARARTNMACNFVRLHDYPRAAEHIEATRRVAVEQEMERYEHYMHGWRARLLLERGDWAAAERDALAEIARDGRLDVVRFQSLMVRAVLMARRGVPGADAAIAELLAFAVPTAEPQRLGPALSARAESAWLRDEPAAALPDLATAGEVLRHSDDRWSRGLVAWWTWRCGGTVGAAELADDLPAPYARALAGDWRGAAEAWDRIGAPYERALVLAHGDAPEAWQESLQILEALGAPAVVAAVRRDLQRRGARGVPRGPRQATRANPAGLTPAQLRVLAELARGLSNAEIAGALALSPRTVDHHVSAILGKLGVATRAAAIAAAHGRRLLS